MPLDPNFKQKIDQIVTSDSVVLFMKGTRSFPQCGFSASVVGILNTLVPKYTTVNILADSEIRNGMKDYSEWPTFPQLFIKGEFVGGADIVRQMHEAGELEKKLGDLVAPMKPPTMTVSPRAAKELAAALADSGSPSDVIHITITPAWEHQLDLGPSEAGHLTVTSAGITLQLDRASAQRAEGVTVDFLDGPDGGGFKIENPNRPAAVKQVSPKDLVALLAGGTVKLYDVRTDKERAVAVVAGSIHLDDAAMAAIGALPKSTPLAFMCHHGNRSSAAAEHFLKEGFTTVYNLAGGIDAWSKDVDPSITRY